ncbi:MauE/DoxX family redox-associated membrane protein [Nonomuraea sp. NPDC050556]|uniref:MauE/DoxX family redox-associated membrane protein n=1 Tax=Nonomuraea sp. NPDC050556 TaxID=3364369 RepID=UPI0037B6EE96
MLICQVLVGATFAYATWTKLRSRTAYREFAGSVRAFRLLPRRLENPAAVTFVAAELAAGAAVVVPSTAAVGFSLAAALLALFSGAIVATILRGRRVFCRCFGASEHRAGWPQVIRNALLLAASVTGLIGSLVPRPAPAPAELAVACTAGIAGALLISRFDDIVDLFRSSSTPL